MALAVASTRYDGCNGRQDFGLYDSLRTCLDRAPLGVIGAPTLAVGKPLRHELMVCRREQLLQWRVDGQPGGGALKANDEPRIAMRSREVYDRYMKYLTGCAKLFHDGYIDVHQFILAKNLVS